MEKSKTIFNNLLNTLKKDSQAKGWIGSILIHLFIFIILAITGVLSLTPLKQTNIIEVTAVSGGAAGSNISPNVEDAPVTPEQIGADAILQHSENAKVKISYDELKQLEPTQQVESNNKNVNIITKNANNNSTNSNNNVGNNSNKVGSDNTDKGAGSGHSSGENNGNSDGNGVDPNSIHQSEQLDVRPAVLRSIKPNYPQDLADDGITGSTVVSIIISTNGSVESVSITKSSGNRRLDAEAKKAAEKFIFSPGKIKNIPVRCKLNKRFDFNIQ